MKCENAVGCKVSVCRAFLTLFQPHTAFKLILPTCCDSLKWKTLY